MRLGGREGCRFWLQAGNVVVTNHPSSHTAYSIHQIIHHVHHVLPASNHTKPLVRAMEVH